MLPDGWVADATRSHIAVNPAAPAAGGYGYFWWINTPDSYEAAGIFGQSITTWPKEKLVIVVNSAWPSATGKVVNETHDAFVQALRAAAR